MIDMSTLVMPGPVIVLRPTLPQVPIVFGTNAAVLNHRAIVRSSLGRFGSWPATEFGRSCPPPLCELSVPVSMFLGKPLDFEKIVLTCQPPRTALPMPPLAHFFPSPNG